MHAVLNFYDCIIFFLPPSPFYPLRLTECYVRKHTHRTAKRGSQLERKSWFVRKPSGMWNELEGAQALYMKMDWWKRGGKLIRGNLGTSNGICGIFIRICETLLRGQLVMFDGVFLRSFSSWRRKWLKIFRFDRYMAVYTDEELNQSKDDQSFSSVELWSIISMIMY